MSDDDVKVRERDPQPGPEAEPDHDAIFEALWARVLESWDDDKPHHALLEYALRAQRLPDAAGHYRAIKEGDPEKAARAQKKLDGIVVAATQMLMAMKTPPERAKVPTSVTVIAFVISFGLLVWLALAVFRR